MKAYFAHIRRDGSKEQTMGAHLLRVGNLMKEDAARIGLSSLAYLIGVLHDLGKCSEEFADYLDWCHKHPEDNSRKGTVDHSSAGGQFLMQRYGRRGDSALLTVHIAALVIFSHHTGLMNYLGEDGVSDFLRRMEKIDVPNVVLSYYYDTVISESELDLLFEHAVHEFTVLDAKITALAPESGEKYHFYWGMIHKLLLSMLVDADRLDSAEFELGEARERVWDTSAIWKDFSDKLEQKLADFTLPSEPKAKEIAHLRQKISEDCLKSAEALPGIYRLCVPTGGGKTLASMRFALQHAQIYQKKRIIVVIPYTSIIDQNVKEIRDIFHMDDAILEHHSNVITEDDGEDTERMDFRRILTERWDVPVIFTTQVQFLNTLFAGDNSSLRRLRALEDSIVIFDEIQTLPVRCTYLFNAAMNFLKTFSRVTAVLCTATQPPLEQLKFPIEISNHADLTSDTAEVFEGFRRVQVENHCEDGGSSVDEIAGEIVHAAEEIGDVLCIVNLTAQARSLCEAVSERTQISERDIHVVHLSTKMCPAHRKAVLRTVREELDARRKYSEQRLICISTQLIEAGVDVSFPVVYRALAGFSSIAQAAGRCNRHGEMERGIVRLFSFANENISRLVDIQQGKKIALDILYHAEADTVLSPHTMELYFRKFYKGYTERDMRFPMKNTNTIFDLLSRNDAGFQRVEENGDDPNLWFSHAFRDAGYAFEVIDLHTESVLVPYAGGKSMILAFNDRYFDRKKIGEQMRTAQQYMVNLFSYELKKLSSLGALRQTESGVMALREEYYNDTFGVQMEEQSNECCMI
ncbi:CRISPR-associated helicase/endonuclease Cas3 [Selenomonas sp. oral taxon 478]|uniref:CRISPR-associated helicase/endonuclease Cas3 n=2 Tax=Selenomonas TaxID=970 RepID=UPI000679F7DF|nr:CRISPR-associated helicase/endonuclease Cas3 [Selenomonas sp. oral taxon 478]AKT54950.1 CRISPR-associated protein Cas3 [Selenomonas sp. oral taxon 478]